MGPGKAVARKVTARRAAFVVAVFLGQLLLSGAPAHAATPVGPYDAWGLRESLRQTRGDVFGGLYADGDGTLVVTAPRGNGPVVAASKAAFDAGGQGPSRAPQSSPRHRIAEVRNSVSRLEDVEKAVLDAPGLFDPDGPVSVVAVHDPSNTVLVGLVADTAANRAAVYAATGAAPGELSFEQQEPVDAAADRFTDVSPFNAGDRVYDENAMFACSSGFGVHQAGTNVDYLLTAAHCSAVAGQQDFFWNGSSTNRRRTPMGFSTNVSFGQAGWDTQLIRTESSTITWTATATRSRITAPYTPIYLDANRVINEGATSIPWRSGAMLVSLTNACVSIHNYPVWGTVRICHLWRATAGPDACAVRGGDSGGPVVAYTGFGPLAAGQIVGGNCVNVYFHAIGDMLARNPHRVGGGLRVNTVSNPG